MRGVDIIMALPSLLLALAIVTILGPGLINAAIAIAITYLPHYIRITRASVIAEKSKDYVIASQVSGAGPLRLIFITILPNCMAPLIVQASLGFSNAILDAAIDKILCSMVYIHNNLAEGIVVFLASTHKKNCSFYFSSKFLTFSQ